MLTTPWAKVLIDLWEHRVRTLVVALAIMAQAQVSIAHASVEEIDTLKALAAQAATAIVNGRLYHSLLEKAEELRGLKEYNENILESLDSGIVVLDLEGRVARWNRAMEALFGRARARTMKLARMEQMMPTPAMARGLRSTPPTSANCSTLSGLLMSPKEPVRNTALQT